MMFHGVERLLLCGVLPLTALLAACGSPKPLPTGSSSSTPANNTVSGKTNTAPPSAPVSALAKFKLSKVSINWLDNPSLPMLNAKGGKGSISNGDTIRALTAVRTSVPRELLAALKSRQVLEGSAQSITLMPVGGLLDAGGNTTALIVRAIVTHASSGAQWKTDLELGDRTGAISAKPAEVASNFASALISNMSQAGLLP